MKNYTLWLPSWYPNRKDAFDGDFIERHAIAVSKQTKVILLFVTKDEQLKSNEVEIEKNITGNLMVYKVYYGKTRWGGMFEKLHSFIKYVGLQKKIYRQIINENGIPDIVHVHVAMKAGLLARYLKKRFQIPFVVTEHWSGYSPGLKQSIYKANWFQRLLNKKILEKATFFLPVSDNLGKTVTKYFTAINYHVVPNVVNTEVFYFAPIDIKKFRFIHPSSMNDYKNPEGLLEACKLVKEKGYDFELLMVGNQPEKLISLAVQLDLSEQVSFMPAVSYAEISQLMQQSSALLMFSLFETQSCVVLEALCCGLPVVGTRVGGIPELIDKENGLLVESENIPALAKAMMQMMDNYKAYSPQLISEKATALFNYKTVAKQYTDIYNKFIEQAPVVE